MYEITCTYGINSTAWGYTLRGIIRGENGDARYFERDITSNGMRHFYERSKSSMVQQRVINVGWRRYDRIFNKV